MGLPHAVRSLADYRRVLERFWGFHTGVEAMLARAAVPAAASRDRAPAARADLRRLGATEAEIARLPTATPRPVDGAAEALGVLYVLEGSRLGGRVIRRDLERRLGPDIATAGSFFGGPSPDWRAFVARLDRELADGPRLERAQGAAARTFEDFIVWFST